MDSALIEFSDQIAGLFGNEPEFPTEAVPRRSARRARTAASPSSRPAPAPAPQPATAAPITNANQIVMPSITWDWPTATSGTISLQEYLFADSVPQSIAGATEYAASADSFSTSYRTFLEFIDAKKFPSADMLAEAKRKIALPAGDPSISSTVPPGWTKVTRAGVQRWAPIWTTSKSPSAWLNTVLANPSGQEKSITVPLRSNSSQEEFLTIGSTGSGDQASVPGAGTAFNKVVVSAKAWGQIAIYPGTWFNSGMLKLGKKYVVDADSFFGPSGILRGRVSAFVVAYDAKFDFESTKPLAANLKSAITGGKNLQAFGVPVTPDTPATAASQNSVVLKSTSAKPTIVLAILESFATG